MLFVESRDKKTGSKKRSYKAIKSTLKSLLNVMFIFYYLGLLPYCENDSYLRKLFYTFSSIYYEFLDLEIKEAKKKKKMQK